MVTLAHTDTCNGPAAEAFRQLVRAAAYRELEREIPSQIESSGASSAAFLGVTHTRLREVVGRVATTTVDDLVWLDENVRAAKDWDLVEWAAPEERMVVTLRSLTVPSAAPEFPISELIAHIEKGQIVPFGHRLAARLRYLVDVSREEAPDQAPLDATSLRGLIAFLANASDLAYPDVMLTDDGRIWIEWQRDADHHFAILFLNEEDVRYVVFAPDPKRPYKTKRVSCTSAVDSIMDDVRHYRVLDWAGATDTEAA